MHTEKTCSHRKVWLFAPLVAASCGQGNIQDTGPSFPGDFNGTPLCSHPDEVLSTDRYGQLICKRLPPGASALPKCKKFSQSLTSDGSRVFCTDRNNEEQSTRDALDTLEASQSLIWEYWAKLNSLGGPSGPAPRAVYCGQYSAAPNQNGAISDGGVTGIVAAASLCRKVTGCRSDGAKMCTVYDLYYSAAMGKLPATLSQSWVFMASWQHNDPAQVPAANGLADNCLGFTYPTGDKRWYGTTVDWKNALTGQKALHFASGPGVVPCNNRFPIACCN